MACAQWPLSRTYQSAVTPMTFVPMLEIQLFGVCLCLFWFVCGLSLCMRLEICIYLQQFYHAEVTQCSWWDVEIKLLARDTGAVILCLYVMGLQETHPWSHSAVAWMLGDCRRMYTFPLICVWETIAHDKSHLALGAHIPCFSRVMKITSLVLGDETFPSLTCGKRKNNLCWSFYALHTATSHFSVEAINLKLIKYARVKRSLGWFFLL